MSTKIGKKERKSQLHKMEVKRILLKIKDGPKSKGIGKWISRQATTRRH
jgi:hypothetical protein